MGILTGRLALAQQAVPRTEIPPPLHVCANPFQSSGLLFSFSLGIQQVGVDPPTISEAASGALFMFSFHSVRVVKTSPPPLLPLSAGICKLSSLSLFLPAWPTVFSCLFSVSLQFSTGRTASLPTTPSWWMFSPPHTGQGPLMAGP